jgi:hypothetical protein
MNDAMTTFYASIEQLDLEDPHPSFDVWAVGIMAYRLISKKFPYA